MRKVIFLLLFFAHSSCAQITFQKTYGGMQDDGFYSVQQTYDSGYVAVGLTKSFGAGNYDIYLVKTDLNGDTLWTRTYGGTGRDIGYYVRQTTDSGYIVIGSTNGNGPGTQGVYLIKTNNNGDSLWTKSYMSGSNGESVGWSVKQTFDGGYILNCTGSWDDVKFLIKTNAIGDTLWTKSYGIKSGSLSEVQQTVDSGYIITGTSESSASLYLIKTDVYGNPVWKKEYIGISLNEGHSGYSVKQTPDGGYIAVGSAWSSSWDVYLIKTNSFGDTLWTKTFAGDSTDVGESVYLTNDSGYIISGFTLSFGAGSPDVYLIKTDSMGDTLWTKSFGGIGSDGSNSVQQTLDGGYILAGSTNGFGAGGNDAYLIKTDSNGNSGCYENNTATIVSSHQTIDSFPIDTFLLDPILVNSYSALASSGAAVSKLCSNIDINENTVEYESSIYPNPAHDYFTIKINAEWINTKIEIYDMLGNIFFSEELKSNYETINCKELSQGIYFVALRTKFKIITKKLIIY